MAHRNWASGGKIYSMHASPVLIDCNFIVDSTNANGLGIRSLKGPCVLNVFMHTNNERGGPGMGNGGIVNPNPQGSSGGGTGSVNLASAANFAIGAYAAITGSTGAGSVVNGNMFITPDTLSSVTNFPPSTVTGAIQAANGIAVQAMLDATAAFVTSNSLSATPIPGTLDGQTLTPGVYSEDGTGSPATFNLATTTDGTLTFNGAGTYIFQAASTLNTGAGGIPTMAFSGGATPSNTFIYWMVGSSATINIGVTSAGSIFYGTVIAQASVTATQAGTIDGRMIALTGAVTLSDTNTINGPSGSSGGGIIVVQLEDNYNRSISGFKAIVSPASGTALKIDNSALTAGVAYIITSLGDATIAQFNALGVPASVPPAVGVSFIASSVGAGSNSSSSRVMATAVSGSNVCSIETIGDPNMSIAPDPTKNQGFGAQFILQCRDFAGAAVAPANGSVISLAFLLNNSSVTLQGE